MAHPALAGLSGLDFTDLKILEELTWLSQDDGYATPSREYLSNIIKANIWTVSRHITKLAKRGFLKVQHRSTRRPDGTVQGRTNCYWVAVDIKDRIHAFMQSLTKSFTGVRPPAHNLEQKIKEPQKDSFSLPQDKNPPWRIPDTWSQAWKRWDPTTLLRPSAPLTKQEQGDIKPAFQRFANLGKK